MIQSKIIKVSEPKVMQSAAGFYIGCSCTSKFPDGYEFEEPYCRDSGYFATEDEASKYLEYITEN